MNGIDITWDLEGSIPDGDLLTGRYTIEVQRLTAVKTGGKLMIAGIILGGPTDSLQKPTEDRDITVFQPFFSMEKVPDWRQRVMKNVATKLRDHFGSIDPDKMDTSTPLVAKVEFRPNDQGGDPWVTITEVYKVV